MAKKKADTLLRRKGRQIIDAQSYQVLGNINSEDLAAQLVRAVNNESRSTKAMRAALNTLKDEYPRSTRQDYPAIALLEQALTAAGDRG